METQQEFIERRRRAHEEAAREAADDPLIRALFGPHEPLKPIKASMLYQPGFLFKRQAGEPIDAPVSSRDTVPGVTVSRRSRLRVPSRKNRRWRYCVRLSLSFYRSFLRIQRAIIPSPAP